MIKTRSRSAISLLLAAAIALAPAVASADVKPEDKALAETLFFAARGLMDAGRVSDACAKFKESYRLDPAAGTLLNLAACHQKEGKIASAWGEYRQAVFDAKKAGREDRIEFAEKGIAEIEPELPYFTIKVPAASRVNGLEVVRNGSVLAAASWDTELPIDPGKVEIVVRAPGYKEQKLTAEIAKKEHKSIEVPKLEPKPVEVAPVKIVETGWSTTRTVGAATFLVGLVGIGLTTYFAVKARDSRNKSDANCPRIDGDLRCNAAGVDAMETASTQAWLANGSAAVAVLGVGIGTYLFIAGRAHPVEQPRAKSSVKFDVAASPLGVTGFLSGSF